MFKNRSIEMKVVKTPKQESYIQIPAARMSPKQIAEIAKDSAKYAAFLAGAGYTLKRVVDTSSEIILIAAKAKIQ